MLQTLIALDQLTKTVNDESRLRTEFNLLLVPGLLLFKVYHLTCQILIISLILILMLSSAASSRILFRLLRCFTSLWLIIFDYFGLNFVHNTIPGKVHGSEGLIFSQANNQIIVRTLLQNIPTDV